MSAKLARPLRAHSVERPDIPPQSKALPSTTTEKQALYMRWRLARMRAVLLGVDFSLQTNERLEASRSLVLNRNILIKRPREDAEERVPDRVSLGPGKCEQWLREGPLQRGPEMYHFIQAFYWEPT